MLSREVLRQLIEALVPSVDAPMVERALEDLERQGEDVGGGVSAFRLAHHLLAHLLERPSLTDTEVTWAYPYLKPAVVAALDALPGYELVEAD